MAEEISTGGLVQSAILDYVQKEVIESRRCSCDDYENCDYENR